MKNYNKSPSHLYFNGPTNNKQKAVRNAFLHAWRGYKKFAWGYDHLKPISTSHSNWMSCGLTIIDSLDTIIIMGLKEEYLTAKTWIEKELNFEKNIFVSLFETTIRILGGLLAAAHLTNEKIFKIKALDLGERLIGAFNSSSPLPYSDVNLKTKEGKEPIWAVPTSLSEITSIQLEFRELSRLTNIDTFEKLAFQVSEHIHSIGCAKHDGLCPIYLYFANGKFDSFSPIKLGARGDSYYEYLLKQWLQTGKKKQWLIEDYKQAISSIFKKLWRYSEPSKFAFIGELTSNNNFQPKMDHLVCFLAGTLALGVYNNMPQFHLEMAKNLSRTCFEFYNTLTGLSPEIVFFNMLPGVNKDLIIQSLDAHSLLRPEAFEAWFYMYRITKDKQYQEWGWKAFQAIEKHAKVEHGYSSVHNVNHLPIKYRDMMESFFLSESLKYLYLLFAEDQNIIPLNKYVFNSEGHPLPIYEH